MLRPEPGNAERSIVDHCVGQQPALRKRGEQHRVTPHDDTERESGDRAGLGTVLPEHPAQERGRDLHERDERDEQYRRERVRLKRGAVIGVSERQQQHDRRATDRKDQSGNVGTRRQAQTLQPQKPRHRQVVADHRRQRDRLDDHHRCRGGEAADEHDERQPLEPFAHRQRQHERVGIDAAAGEAHQAPKRDRQDKQIERERIERQEPNCLADMTLADVLDDADLELPRKAHHRERRDEHQRHPAGRAAGCRIERQQAAQVRGLCGARKHVAQPVIDAIDDKRADSEERRELHDGFEGDRGNHSLVPLGRVQMPRAEQHCEEREDQRDVERRVFDDRRRVGRRRRQLRKLGDDRVAVRHCLQLERHVRNHADQRNDRHHRGDQTALAITPTDEVRNRRNPIRLTDPYHLAKQHPAERRVERRTERHRDDRHAGVRRAADGAVERERRRINP